MKQMMNNAPHQDFSRTLLQDIVDGVPMCVFWKDRESRYLGCNALFARDAGLSCPDELVGKTDFDMRWKKQAELYRADDKRVMDSGIPRLGYEESRIGQDGKTIWRRVSKLPLRGAAHEVIGVLGIYEDIGERKLGEQARLESQDRLREQKEFLASIFENALDAVVLMDAEGVITCWNSQAEKTFGWSRKEAVGRLLHETIVPSRHREAHVSGLRRFLSTGESSRLNARIEIIALHRDGREFPAELSISPIKTADRYEFSAFVRDISKRKRVERQLAEREELFSAIFKQSPSGIELIDPDTLRFAEANPAACRMLGYTHEEYLRLRITDIQADMDEETLVAAVRQLEVSGGATFENRHRSKNGDILDVEINARMLDMPGKRLLVGVWHDITGRKRAEENLRIIASVFDNSQESILITDADNAIIDVNPAFTRTTGYSREEVLGRNPKLLGSGRQDKAFYAEMWQALKQDGAWRGEIWNRRKSGEFYAELLSVSAIRDEDGKVQRHVGVFSDISHLKEHEAELSRIAHYDALTGIPNRVLLADRMRQAIAQ
ncbi:MAG: PAS domain S-box protein, partial [Sulfuricellaceae bacterium]|nr:PAS domain S-box protein [Sulfuricellaceae bacterium]